MKKVKEYPESYDSDVFDEFEKASLFDTVRKNGCLVRKSFSMGAADTKRFYLECRKIK